MSLRPFLAMYLAIGYCGVRMGQQVKEHLIFPSSEK